MGRSLKSIDNRFLLHSKQQQQQESSYNCGNQIHQSSRLLNNTARVESSSRVDCNITGTTDTKWYPGPGGDEENNSSIHTYTRSTSTGRIRRSKHFLPTFFHLTIYSSIHSFTPSTSLNKETNDRTTTTTTTTSELFHSPAAMKAAV